jgi:hypothetical protein
MTLDLITPPGVTNRLVYNSYVVVEKVIEIFYKNIKMLLFDDEKYK